MKVPKTMREKYDAIAPLITEFCIEYLNEEYAEMSLLLLEKLCRKRPSPVVSGNPKTWACGIVYTVGSVNFLFDKSQTPHMRASELAEKFGISPSTAGNKAGDIKKKLNIGVFEPEWTLPSRLGDNPMIWMFESSSGFIFDARHAPLDIQEELFDAGMIPYIPDYRKDSEEIWEEDIIKPINADAPKKKSSQTTLKEQISIEDYFSTDTNDDDHFTDPPPRQPKQSNNSGNIITLGSIEDYCENNQDFMRLLKKFSDGYIREYNKRKVALRNEVKVYLRRNFNTWYYSEINAVFPISPARFINSDINNKFNIGTVVFPVPEPVFTKSGISEIQYSFHVFTLDNHPFIRDLRLFLKSVRSIRKKSGHTEKYDSMFTYVITYFQDITESAEFTFKEIPYILALGDVCERLSFISLSDIRGGITINKKTINIFFSRPGKKKLGKVIDVLIKRFTDSFKNLELFGRRPDAEDVSKVLQEVHDIESFTESLFGEVFTDLIDRVQTYADESSGLTDFLESFDEGELEAMLEAQTVIRLCCSHFFTIFGQYLQVIQPEHSGPFIFSISDDEYLDALEYEGEKIEDYLYKISIGAMIYHLPPGGYCMTPLGADWFGIDLSGQEESIFSPVPPDYYQEIFDGMIEDE